MYDFCVTYGFRETDTALEGPKRFSQYKTFWSLIASGDYSSNSSSQNRLRHPAIRIVARVLSNMLFNRATGNKVHLDELLLLFLGCGPIMGDGYAEQFESYRSNLGIRFAETICAVKDSPKQRTERIGSLLTTLFRHLKVDLSKASSVSELARVDMEHLLASKIIIKPCTYSFLGANGEPSYVELPNLAITQLFTRNDLAFLPPPEYLVPNPSRTSSAARPSTSRRSTSRQPRLDTEDAGPSVPRLALPYHDTPPQGEFDLAPISDDADGAEYRKWMIQSTKKNNSIMQRIMQALSKGCCRAPAPDVTAPAPTERAPAPSHSSSHSGQSLRRKKRRTADDDTDDA